MQQIGNTRRPADIRKCALIASVLAAISMIALETAGSAIKGNYAGLDGTLSPADTKGSLAVVPAGLPH